MSSQIYDSFAIEEPSSLSYIYRTSFSSSQPLLTTSEVPLSLQHIGRLNHVVKWTKDTHDVFIKWWQATTWYEQHERSMPNILAKIAWDSTNRRSQQWRNYHQGADKISGEPYVVCCYCSKTLTHPGIKSTGPKSMATHLSSDICKKSQGWKDSLQQRRIDEMPA